MDILKNNKGTPTKVTSNLTDGINSDYDFNIDYVDGDTSSRNKSRTSNSVKPDDVERRDGPGGE